MYFYKKSYDANEVWGFLEEGPFNTQEELKNSFVFQHYDNEAAFAIIQNLNDRILGVAMVSKDNPKNPGKDQSGTEEQEGKTGDVKVGADDLHEEPWHIECETDERKLDLGDVGADHRRER